MKKTGDMVIVDASTQTVRCERCGEEIPIPLGTINWVLSVMKAFEREHKTCKKGDEHRCFFSKPKKETEDVHGSP